MLSLMPICSYIKKVNKTVIAVKTRRTHWVRQIRGSSWYCAGELNGTGRGKTVQRVGHFAQAINSKSIHSLDLLPGERAVLPKVMLDYNTTKNTTVVCYNCEPHFRVTERHDWQRRNTKCESCQQYITPVRL